jgi:subtilisin family serine protease
MSGTSMATPHIAGLAALLFEAKPSATAADVEKAIFNSSKLGTIPKSRGNRGMPDGVVALSILTGTSVGGSKGTTVKVASKKSGKKSPARKRSKKAGRKAAKKK